MTMLILITKRIFKAVDNIKILYTIIAVYYLQILHN